MEKGNIKIKEQYTIDITDMGDSGEGIGRIDGLTIFVPGGISGDTLDIEIKTLKKSYGIAEMKTIVKASPYRIESDCDHFPKCGGCQLRNMSYDGQLLMKERNVKDALIRIGGFENLDVEKIIGMENPIAYRNKCQYPVGRKNGKIVMGFYERKTHVVEDLISCHIQSDEIDKLVQKLRELMISEEISVYDEKTGKGLLRHIMVRESSMTGGIMIVFVLNGIRLKNSEYIVDKLLEFSNKIETIAVNINRKKGNTILGYKNAILHGTGKIKDKIGDLLFEISPLSFFQINKIQTEKLYEKALEYADLKGTETVFDIYSGIGTISLFLAKKAKKVYGIEIIEDAVEDARINAKINGIENVEFVAGSAELEFPKLLEILPKIDVVVVDPPRKGCEKEVLDTILEINPEKVVYVSCKPSTLARDLKYLCEDGRYEIKSVQPVDMFPYSVHVECVVKLERR